MSDERQRHEPLSDEEYLRLCRQYGIAEADTFPSDEQVRDSYPADHVWDLGDGRTIRHGDLWADDGDERE